MGVRRKDFFRSLLHKRADELLVKARALVARMEEEISPRGVARVKGLPEGIDPSKPPKNFKDAMNRIDRQQWADCKELASSYILQQKVWSIECLGSGAECDI